MTNGFAVATFAVSFIITAGAGSEVVYWFTLLLLAGLPMYAWTKQSDQSGRTARIRRMSRTGTTAIHRMVARCRAGDHPALVAKLGSGWVVMGDRQAFPGHCMLLPDPVVPHLNALDGAGRAQFLRDMAAVGDAVLACTGAVRINYALFGNAEPALHAHVIPRRSDESPEIRNTHPWAADWSQAPEYSEVLHGELRSRIADSLGSGIRGAR